MKNKSAFTLIELSIVLVILGLIVGGVLVGKDLIKAAELRKIITDSDKFITAYYAFKNKYNCIPGDCPNATQFFSGTLDGNGDGIIVWQNGAGNEGVNVWNHFANAGLIDGTFPVTSNIGAPVIDIRYFYIGPIANTVYAVKNAKYGNASINNLGWGDSVSTITRPVNSFFITLGIYNSANPRGYAGGLRGIENKSIDDKIDDGIPQRGKTGAAENSSGCFTTGSTDPDTSYDVSSTSAARVFIRQF